MAAGTRLRKGDQRGSHARDVRAAVRRAAVWAAEGLEVRRLLSTTFTVTTTADTVDPADGVVSLREAITSANSAPDVDTIAFDIAPGGPQTIRPLSQLPSVTSGVIIDGRTQPGYVDRPIIQLSGELAGADAEGLRIGSLGSTVRGLVVSRFGSSGIRITASASGNVIVGNFIGTDLTGAAAAGNARGVQVEGFNNVVGGTAAEDRNVISGNTASAAAGFGRGVELTGAAAHDNVVQGNYIGTDPAGTAALPNNGDGVTIVNGANKNTVGGTAAGARNLISGNRRVGVWVNGATTTGNVILGNYVGTNAAGTAALGNGNNGAERFSGLQADNAPGNTFGGTAAGAGNLVSGNFLNGILILGNAPGTVVQGNLIGTNAAGTAAIGNAGDGVSVTGGGATNNQIGGTTAGARNVISGNGRLGVWLNGPNNVVQGNYIGTNAAGTAAIGNGFGAAPVLSGVLIDNAWGNVVGGGAPGAGNLISGNAASGVDVAGFNTFNSRVSGNRIGTNAAGTAALPNLGAGVLVRSGAQFNSIGTDADGANDAAEGNLISGNGDTGVTIADGGTYQNTIAGNRIGTDVTGTLPLGNVGFGVYVRDFAFGNVIGNRGFPGTVAGDVLRNVISATVPNAQDDFGDGIKIERWAAGTFVAGNFIGTDATGTKPLGNARWGVFVQNQAGNNTVGFDADGRADAVEGNVIAANGAGGAFVANAGSTFNRVDGNLIGTDVTGTLALGNGGPGVRVSNGAFYTEVAANTIAHNAAEGVRVATGADGDPRYTEIRRNAIFDNGDLGIDLAGDDVTPNDPFDADDGPNGRQNAPVVTSVTPAGPGQTIVAGRLSSAPFSNYTIDFFASPAGTDPAEVVEGRRYLGSASVFTDFFGQSPFEVTLDAALAAGEIVTATATATNFFGPGETSELSSRVVADAGGSYLFTEGQGGGGDLQAQLAGVALDLGGDAVTFAWDLDGDGAFDDSTALNPTVTVPDDGPFQRVVALRVTNSGGQSAVGTAVILVQNAAPEITAASVNGGPANPIAPGKPAVVTGTFTDPGLLDTHTGTVDWGDGTSDTIDLTRPAGSADGAFSFSHVYAQGGIYFVSVAVADDDGDSSFYGLTAYVTGAGVQFGTLNVVGTAASDTVTVTADADGSVSVAASFLPAVQRFAAGEFFNVFVLLGGKNDVAAVRGPGLVFVQMDGGDGNDTLAAGAGGSYLFGGAGNDTLTGGAGPDTLDGADGNDTLRGGDNAESFAFYFDSLYGGNGNDSITAGSGPAYVAGGEGNDLITGGAGNDNLYGELGDDVIAGGGGDDYLDGGEGNDALDGGAGADYLSGWVGDDSLGGGDGPDVLFGSAGNDALAGGHGADVYYFEQAWAGPEADTVSEPAKDPAENTLDFSFVFDSTDGVIVDLTRNGPAAIRHRNGSRTVALGGAATFSGVFGGWGDDQITGNDADNVISGYEGNDTIDGGRGNDALFGDGGDDVIHGGPGNDTLYGGWGNDRLYGDDGNDTLTGDPGADLIDGGTGTDTLADPGDPEDILNSIENA